ncbi:MAG TPA: hypothetical protein VNK94_07300 [Gaiellaceae bacterium]|nr:hypothetical protein [Gaiellaceae bacterium]
MPTDLTNYLDPVDGPVRFICEQIELADGRRVGDALAEDPWIERDFLRPLFEQDAAGRPCYRLCYLELPRGHWKSGGAGAVALAEAVLYPSTDVVVAAADRDQAAIVGENIAAYLARNRSLRGSFKRRGDEYAVPARGSRIRVIASDAPTAWGLGGTHRRFRVIADELTNWRSEDLWIALASASGKVADAQTIVISNAGFDAGSSWQWRIREAAEREPWAYLFSPPGPIASWVSEEWQAQMRALLPGPAFDRAILNVWAAQSGDFVTREQWRRCVDPGLHPQTAGVPTSAPYVAGLDLGLTKDRTALAIAHLDAEQNVVLDELVVWQGSRSEPVDIGTIERAVVDAHRRYPQLRVFVDPWQLKGSLGRLQAEGVYVREFTFSATSVARLSSILYELISAASLRVFEDAELEREILGLVVTQTAAGWRIDHRAGAFSDRAIALALAAQEAVAMRQSTAPLPPRREPDALDRAPWADLVDLEPGGIRGDPTRTPRWYDDEAGVWGKEF